MASKFLLTLVGAGALIQGHFVLAQQQEEASLGGNLTQSESDNAVNADPEIATSVADENQTVNAIPVQATSEASEPQESSKPTNRMSIDEVIVTAQRREENLQNVPVSVSAFTGDTLEARGFSDPKDLQNITPGLQYGEMAGYSMVFIRGVGSDAFQGNADSSVATYIDGLYMPYTINQAQALGEVERIEVLKGPQGALYGRNAVGGAISVLTKQPGDQASLSVTADYGAYNDLRGRVYGTLPVADTVSIALSAIYRHRDSYVTNLDDDAPDYRPTVDKGLRAAIAWRPTDTLTAIVTAYQLENQGPSSDLGTLTEVSPILGTAVGLQANTKPQESSADPGVGHDVKVKVYSLNINWDAEWFNLKSITGQQHLDGLQFYDYDSTSKPVVDFRAFSVADYFSQELQFLSNDSTPSWFEWLFGLYYADGYKGFPRVPATVPAGNLIQWQTTESPLVGQLVSLFPVLPGLIQSGIPDDLNVNLFLHTIMDTTSYSAYGQGTVHFTDWFSVIAGLRYNREEASIDSATTDVSLTGVPLVGETPELRAFTFLPQDKTWENWSPKISFNFIPMNDTLVYASYSTGFKTGNYNGVNVYVKPSRVEPEKIDSYEIGVKSDLLKKRLRANASIFRNQVTDGQVQFISLTSGGLARLENAAGYTIEGVDIDVTAAVTDSLILAVNASYLDGKYDDYIGSGFNPTTGLFVNNIDYKGNTTIRTPKFTTTVAANYAWEMLDLDWELGADVYYNDGYFYDSFNTVRQPSYHLLNARISAYDARSRVRVTLWGANLEDKGYTLQQFPNDFGIGTIWANPRTFGITVKWEL